MSGERFGALTIDRDGHRALLDGVDIRLTRSELAVLLALSSSPRVAMRNREILEAMWGSQWQADTTPLQVHVSRLRRKLGESGTEQRYIVTVHGFGYRFDPDPDGLTVRGEGPSVREVVLSIDQDLILRDVQPRAPVLGWEVAQIIGTPFSPTGLAPDVVMSLVGAVLATGAREIDGQIQALRADGTTLSIRAHTKFVLDDEGSFLGLNSTLYLPAE